MPRSPCAAERVKTGQWNDTQEREEDDTIERAVQLHKQADDGMKRHMVTATRLRTEAQVQAVAIAELDEVRRCWLGPLVVADVVVACAQ